MAEYIVEPKSRQDIRDLTLMLRKFLGLENEKYFPITELLDVLAEIFDNFSYEIFIAQYNYQKLQSEMENIASPKWRKLQRIF